MVNVVAEDDGLVEAITGLQVLRNFACDQLRAFFQHQRAIEIALVVDAVFDLVAVFVEHALVRTPAGQVFVEIDAHHLVGCEETIVDALTQ